MEKLSLDLIQYIFSHLSPKHIFYSRLICKKIYNIYQDKYFWQLKLKRDYPKVETKNFIDNDFRNLYKLYYYVRKYQRVMEYARKIMNLQNSGSIVRKESSYLFNKMNNILSIIDNIISKFSPNFKSIEYSIIFKRGYTPLRPAFWIINHNIIIREGQLIFFYPEINQKGYCYIYRRKNDLNVKCGKYKKSIPKILLEKYSREEIIKIYGNNWE